MWHVCQPCGWLRAEPGNPAADLDPELPLAEDHRWPEDPRWYPPNPVTPEEAAAAAAAAACPATEPLARALMRFGTPLPEGWVPPEYRSLQQQQRQPRQHGNGGNGGNGNDGNDSRAAATTADDEPPRLDANEAAAAAGNPETDLEVESVYEDAAEWWHRHISEPAHRTAYEEAAEAAAEEAAEAATEAAGEAAAEAAEQWSPCD